MREAFDFILIGLLLLNIYRTYADFSPETEVLGTTIPTMVAVAIQVVCILLLAYKIYRDYATEKQV